MAKLRSLPRPVWIGVSFVLGVVIGLALTWGWLGAFATMGGHGEMRQLPMHPGAHAPYQGDWNR